MPTMSEVLQKVLDNANLGKAVTDVGPGFVLSMGLLMGVGLGSSLSIMPADRIQELQQDFEKAKNSLVSKKLGFQSLLRETPGGVVTCGGQGPAKLDPDDAEDCYLKGLRSISALTVDVENYWALKKANTGPDRVLALERLQRFSDRLLSQKELVEAQAAKVQQLENQLTDARSLEFNLVGFTSNLSAIIAFAIVFGVIVSQVSRVIFVNLIYSRFSKVKELDDEEVTVEQKLSKEDDALITDYYRYVEGSINMIFPVLLLSFVFPAYAAKRLGAPLGEWWAPLVGIVVAVLLALSGYYTYIKFLKRRKQLAAAVAADGKSFGLTSRTSS